MILLAEQFSEALFYVFFAGPVFACLLLLVSILLLPFFWRRERRYVSSLSKAALFLGLLFVWGGVANGLWFLLSEDRWYVQGDPIVRYFPLVLFGEWWLDEPCGGHMMPGVSILRVQIYWGLLTAGVWGLAGLSYARLRRSRNRNGQISGPDLVVSAE